MTEIEVNWTVQAGEPCDAAIELLADVLIANVVSQEDCWPENDDA